MATNETQQDSVQVQSNPPRAPDDALEMALDAITLPGAYVCRRTGDLIRIAPSGERVGGAELTRKNDAEPMRVTWISPDPFLAITQARIAAANLDIEIAF